MYTPLPSQANLSVRSLRRIGLLAAAVALAIVLGGCATNVATDATTASTGAAAKAPQITGLVYGGQSAISGAAIQLYAVGTAGLDSASTPLIPSSTSQTVGQNVTDANGSFNISGLYNLTTCNTAGTLVYIVATGGTAAGNTSANADIALVAALGSCTAIANSASPVHILMNEVNTVAAAYALAPFASSLTSIGATYSSGTPPTGLVNAFANANLISPYSSGYPGSGALATGVTVPVAEVDTIADIFATCVNSNGGSSGDSSNCGKIFAATGVTTNTFDAALQFAKHPGATAITSLYSLVPGTGAPFVPTLALTSAPNDFSVAVTYAGGSGTLATPFGIAIDSSGDAWVTNESGATVSEFSPTGTVLNSLAPAGLYGAKGIAISPTGVVWVANTAGNSAFAFTLSGGTLASTATYPAATFGLSAPSAVAVDSSGNAYFTNFNGNSVTGISSGGTPIAGSPFTGNGNITVPSGIALDTAGNLYVTSGSGSIIELTHAGAYSATLNDGTLQGPVSVALDPSNRLLASGSTTGSAVGGALSEFSGGTASAISPVTSGLSSPAGIATDGVSIWVANSITAGGLAQFVYGSVTPASPAAGFGSLNSPVGVAVDTSGSVWTTNSGSNTVSKFIGLGNVPGASSNMASYKGIVATRGYVSNLLVGGANATWVMNRSFHIARDNISAGTLQVVWGNYLSNYGGDSTYGPGTYKAAIEYPAGTITPCTFSGAATGTVAGGTDAITDPCGPAVPDGATFWVRMLYTNPNGIAYVTSITMDDLTREQFAFGTGTPVDAVNGGTITTTSGGLWIRPLALVAPTTNTSICIIGDSRAEGIADAVTDATGDIGEITRSIGPVYGYTDLAVSGESAEAAVTQLANRSRMFNYCSHVIDEYGIIDLALAEAPGDIATARTALARMSGKPTYGTTLPAWTTSTDNWATLANQTTEYNTNAFNSLVRSGISGETGYFDVIAGLDPSDLQKFPVGPAPGTAFYSTLDGIHENSTGDLIIRNSGVITPSILQR
jgi:hypothetical protein